jgi:DNA-binding NarL/FixJ family response regulator
MTAASRRAEGRTGRGDRIAAALGLAPAPASALREQPMVLTRREDEISHLMAEGLTNRQIAEQLFIAQRTVDTHVGHILSKLGCSNRAQVAALTGKQAGKKIRIPGT